MRWPWQRAARTTACPYRRLLPSSTAGVPFEAAFTIVWRPTWRTRRNLDELVRHNIHRAAIDVASRLEAADLHAARDVINAALGDTDRTHTPHYQILAVRVTLQLSSESREVLARRRTDEDRVRRLQFLKTHLYDHPDLLVLDRLERQSDPLTDRHIAELQRLARSIRACDRWWHPILEQWEQLGQGFNDPDRQQRAMLALFESLKAFNGGTLPAFTASDDSRPRSGPHESTHEVRR